MGRERRVRPFAGIEGAERPWLFVQENATLLRRYAYVEERLMRLLAGHVPGTARWEVKHALPRHSWEDAQHADALRRRIVTMRTSERLLDESPDDALTALLDEAGRAADTVELLAGIHGLIKPALLAAYRWHLATTNGVADFPTVREIRIIAREEAEQIEWAEEALAELCQEPAAPERAAAWKRHLQTFLDAAGGIAGREARGQAEPPRADKPFAISRHPKRDPRFPINFEFNEPGDDRDPSVPGRLVSMMRGRLNELAACECVASAIYEAEGQPFAFAHELTRHMWDEARHSMLGQAVLQHLGHDIRSWPLRIGPGYGYLTVGPMERFAYLGLVVEQGMMKYPPGKREEYEWCRDVARDALAAMYQDYDWADEVYHTQIARRWVARNVKGGPDAMRDYARDAGQRLAANKKAIAELWHRYRAQGRTLQEGDPLPVPAGAKAAIASEYEAPELSVTREELLAQE